MPGTRPVVVVHETYPDPSSGSGNCPESGRRVAVWGTDRNLLNHLRTHDACAPLNIKITNPAANADFVLYHTVNREYMTNRLEARNANGRRVADTTTLRLKNAAKDICRDLRKIQRETAPTPRPAATATAVAGTNDPAAICAAPRNGHTKFTVAGPFGRVECADGAVVAVTGN